MRPSEAVERHRSDAKAIIARYPLENPRIFGSAARNADTERSDLDILVKRTGDLTYFDLAVLERDLSALMGVKVDVRTEGEFSDLNLRLLADDLVAL
ncbi:nucleotidyltransferase family protein [Hoeflea ulvae]|uniref:Nucleotidyltransferase domain-containing protein n=1 Tax=Hoeflea ulvae TaxID=2983764 RepID=A0ABT3YGU1_9HYPH|nr:nucleotidyltransferase domain-containing protein [Hoeflea ulvae]MCY0095098.1 nucleotidyltransferase domain-containing protein [Hoeflea ulvae]